VQVIYHSAKMINAFFHKIYINAFVLRARNLDIMYCEFYVYWTVLHCDS